MRIEVDQIIENTVGLSCKDDELFCTIIHVKVVYEVILYKKQGDWYYMTIEDYTKKLQVELENEHDAEEYIKCLRKIEYQIPVRLGEILDGT